MKNTIFKLTEYVYYFSLLVLLILYLFPGSLIGYFLYGNLGQQPNLITNPIGTSINHLIFFSYITVLVIIVRLRIKNIFTNSWGNKKCVISNLRTDDTWSRVWFRRDLKNEKNFPVQVWAIAKKD